MSKKENILEHHRELLQSVLAHTRLVASLDLLLQVMLHSHSQLIELVPLLSKTHRAIKNERFNFNNAQKERRRIFFTCAQCNGYPK